MTWPLTIIAFFVSVAFSWWTVRVDMEPRWALLSVLVPFVFAKAEMKQRPAHVILILFLGYAALSLTWAQIRYDALYNLWHLVVLAAVFCLAMELENPKPVYIALAVGIGISGFLCVVTTFGWLWLPSATRVSGLLVNRNFLAETAVPLVILAVAYRWWLLLPGIILAAFMPGSRAAMGALGVTAVIALWQKSRRLAVVAGIVAALGLGAFVAQEPARLDTLTQRIDMWRDAWDGMTVQGNGIGQFYVMFPKAATRTNTTDLRPDHAHDELVEWTFELGVVGAVGFAAFVSLALGTSPEQLALAGLLLCAVFGFPLHEPCSGFLAATLAGRAYRNRALLRERGPVGATYRDPGLLREGPNDAGTLCALAPVGEPVSVQPADATRARDSSSEDDRLRAAGLALRGKSLFAHLRSLVKGPDHPRDCLSRAYGRQTNSDGRSDAVTTCICGSPHF